MQLNHSIKVGFNFGLTSGIITTLGLMVGLQSGTNSRLAVIGGILTIAIADAMSDALGIHIAEESENIHSELEIWQSTIATFLFKFCCASLFVIPVLILSLSTAIIVSIVGGLLALTCLSYFLAIEQNEKPLRIIGEHLLIATLVIILTHFVGLWIAQVFN